LATATSRPAGRRAFVAWLAWARTDGLAARALRRGALFSGGGTERRVPVPVPVPVLRVPVLRVPVLRVPVPGLRVGFGRALRVSLGVEPPLPLAASPLDEPSLDPSSARDRASGSRRGGEACSFRTALHLNLDWTRVQSARVGFVLAAGLFLRGAASPATPRTGDPSASRVRGG
jgi:hypothetical protein